MTWSDEELKQKMVENPDLAKVNKLGNPLPSLAAVLQEKQKRRNEEEELQNKIIEVAKIYGWLVHAERPARTSKGYRTPIQGDTGFPDLVLTRNKDILFVECKSEKGKLSDAQKIWLTELDKNPTVRCLVWRLSDWELIYSTLQQRRET